MIGDTFMPEPPINLEPATPDQPQSGKTSSPRKIESSRANGKLSRGPTTPEGRQACAKNPIKHGMLARTVVLSGESQERFDAILNSFLATYRPANGPEYILVYKMIVAHWRQLRA